MELYFRCQWRCCITMQFHTNRGAVLSPLEICEQTAPSQTQHKYIYLALSYHSISLLTPTHPSVFTSTYYEQLGTE